MVSTEQNMPAASVLKPGDVITAVDGQSVTMNGLSARISAVGIGRRLQLTVSRGGKILQLVLTVAKGNARGGPLSASSSSLSTRSRSR